MSCKIKILIAVIITGLLVLNGCGTTKMTEHTETIIKPKAFKVALPAINDTLNAIIDTVYVHGEKIIEGDTVTVVKYYPRLKKITIHSKPDTIFITQLDTVTITNTVYTEEPNFIEKNIWYFIIIAVIVVIIIAIIKK